MLSGILNRIAVTPKGLKEKETQTTEITSFKRSQTDNKMSSQISGANFKAAQNLQNKNISFTGWQAGPYGSMHWVDTGAPNAYTSSIQECEDYARHVASLGPGYDGPYISDLAEELAKSGKYLEAAKEKIENAAKHRKYNEERNAYTCEKTAHEYLEKAVAQGYYKEAAKILEQIAKTHDALGNSEAAYLLRITANEWASKGNWFTKIFK